MLGSKRQVADVHVGVADIRSDIANQTWRQAEDLARAYLRRVKTNRGFCRQFEACVSTLENYLEVASIKIGRLG